MAERSGARMDVMIACPTCGNRNETPSPVCARCGGSLLGAAASTESPPRPLVSLRVVRADGGPEQVVQMRQDVLTCGRRGDLALVDDPFVAADQARFFFSGPRLAVEDVGGGNGVFQRLHAERELPVGSELRFGRQRLILEPIPAAQPGPEGTLAWGSPDAGYRFRLLQLLEGGARGGAFPLREGHNLLGRELGDITFPSDGFVSGRHAMLTVEGVRVLVRDLGSSNGTFIRLGAPTYVDHGDQFLMGRQLLRLELQPLSS